MTQSNPKRSSLGLGKYLPLIFNFSDLVLVNMVFIITLVLYPEIGAVGRHLRVLWFMVNLCYVPVMVRTARNQHNARAILMDHVLRSALSATGLHALLFLSMLNLLRINIIPFNAYVTMYAMMGAALTVWSLVSRWMLKRMRRKGYNFLRVVIIGSNVTSRRLLNMLMSDIGFGYKVIGVFDDREPEDRRMLELYKGDIDQLDAFVKEKDVDQIFYTIPGQNEELARVVRIADNNVCDFYYVPQISRLVSSRFQLHSIGGMPVMTILRNPLSSALNRVIKRTLDLVISSVFLLFYPLIYIPVAIAIKVSSPGPVYFKQERTGYRGRSFMCLKFRTMRVNADSERVQATRDDPRKTRVGDFLRRTSIDELPQFINVWKGDMSVVGPRPHMLKHTEDYSKLVDRYMVRHIVKPGITGWAQVNGYRGITDELWKMERRVEHDVWYIENWTLALDLKIIARTVMNALGGEKNAF